MGRCTVPPAATRRFNCPPPSKWNSLNTLMHTQHKHTHTPHTHTNTHTTHTNTHTCLYIHTPTIQSVPPSCWHSPRGGDLDLCTEAHTGVRHPPLRATANEWGHPHSGTQVLAVYWVVWVGDWGVISTEWSEGQDQETDSRIQPGWVGGESHQTAKIFLFFFFFCFFFFRWDSSNLRDSFTMVFTQNSSIFNWAVH